MIAIPIAVFVLIALGAIAFAAGPVLRPERRAGADSDGAPAGDGEADELVSAPTRDRNKARWLLVGAIALFLLGVGGGTYWFLGAPGLAVRAVTPPGQRSLKGLVPLLVARVRQSPQDATGWTYLGRAYMTLRDPGDAAKAFAQAVALVRGAHRNDPDLFSAYGEALVQQDGAVGDEAQAAFTAALAGNPKDMAARFYLGMARAEHGDKSGAMALWQSLAADVPANSALHQMLVDRIAMLAASSGGAAPDPRQMVAGLAARLKASPNDAAGWQRLIRAYHVLGQDSQAKEALATARKTFAADKNTLAMLDQEAKELKLE